MRPDETMHRYATLVQQRDLEGLLNLYEAGASFFPAPGVELAGHPAIRASLLETFSLEPTLRVTPVEVLVVGDLAFVCNEWTLAGKVQRSGRSAVVLRRQPAGDWRIVIDRP
jgi:ketosteroid isomerase-like protein